MSFWRQLTHGMRALRQGPTRDRELADEVQHFFDQSVAAHIGRGQSPAEARRAALREIGNVTVAREQVRSYGWENTVDELAADVRYAARRLRGSPGFTAVAVITLALGIGGSTAIFSAVNPILFEPLPYPGAKQLVAMEDQLADGSGLATTFGTYREVAQRTRSFEGIAASVGFQPTLAGRDQPERIDGQWVSANYFRVLGVAPALGRDFDPANDRPNAPTTVILSDRLWRRAFNGDSSIIGRRIRLDDTAYAVAGVLPASFESVPGSPADVWVLLQLDVRPDSLEGPAWAHFLQLTGRLRPGVSVDQARRDLDAVARNPIPEFRRPPWAAMRRAMLITSLHEDATRAVKPALLAVFGAVLLVLVIACVNVTNLLVARGVQRQGELAMRAALGAGRGRLVRQLLTESLMLATLGGAVGILVAHAGVRALIALAPANLPRIDAIGVDGPALLFALGVSSLIGIAIGLSPAFQASRTDLKAGLREGTRRVSGGHHLARRALVVAEVALALMLLVSAGLLLRSLELLFSVDPGFAPAQLATMQLRISGQRYQNDTVSFDFVARALEAVRRVPGVTSAAFTSQLPLSGDEDEYGVHFRTSGTSRTASEVIRYAVTPGYFETMGIPRVQGRLLEKTDRLGTPLAVVLNESFARRMFPGKSPLGQQLHIGPDRGPWFTVVGVVRDVKQLSLAGRESDAAYIPTDQSWFADRALWLVARVQGDPAAIAPRLRDAIWSVDRTQSVTRVGTMNHVVTESAAQRRFAMIVFEVFAAVALVLAAIGIYGVISGSVTERIREIGIRSALGASSGDIVGLVVRQGMTMTVLGMLIGLPAAVAATRLLVTLLYGVSRVDAWTYGAVVVLLGGVAAMACWIPASRAARVDPTITLRQ
jgi:putative ABC transport system permease protein